MGLYDEIKEIENPYDIHNNNQAFNGFEVMRDIVLKKIMDNVMSERSPLFNKLVIDMSRADKNMCLGTECFLNGEKLVNVISASPVIEANNKPRFTITLVGEIEVIPFGGKTYEDS